MSWSSKKSRFLVFLWYSRCVPSNIFKKLLKKVFSIDQCQKTSKKLLWESLNKAINEYYIVGLGTSLVVVSSTDCNYFPSLRADTSNLCLSLALPIRITEVLTYLPHSPHNFSLTSLSFSSRPLSSNTIFLLSFFMFLLCLTIPVGELLKLAWLIEMFGYVWRKLRD